MESLANNADARNLMNKPNKCNATNDINGKIAALMNVLIVDLDACDMKWTFFVAAAHSYRYDSQLKPYPIHPITGKPYEIENLHEIIANVLPFSDLLKKLQAKQPIADEIVHLLYWILVRLRDPYLKSVHRSNVSFFLFSFLLMNLYSISILLFNLTHTKCHLILLPFDVHMRVYLLRVNVEYVGVVAIRLLLFCHNQTA